MQNGRRCTAHDIMAIMRSLSGPPMEIFLAISVNRCSIER